LRDLARVGVHSADDLSGLGSEDQRPVPGH
jgi:hypothetical protein